MDDTLIAILKKTTTLQQVIKEIKPLNEKMKIATLWYAREIYDLVTK